MSYYIYDCTYEARFSRIYLLKDFHRRVSINVFYVHLEIFKKLDEVGKIWENFPNSTKTFLRSLEVEEEEEAVSTGSPIDGNTTSNLHVIKQTGYGVSVRILPANRNRLLAQVQQV